MANLDRTRVRAPGRVELEDRRSQPDEKWAIAISYVAAVAQPIIGVIFGLALLYKGRNRHAIAVGCDE